MLNLLKNHYKKLVCILIGLVLLLGYTLSGLFTQSGTNLDSSMRTIDVNQMTNGEKINTLLNDFNNYEVSNSGTSVNFEGDMFASIGEILGFDSLANQENEVVKKFKTRYDYETNMFYMDISYFTNGILLETISAEVEPLYDEVRDDGYIEYEGKRYYFSECFGTNGLNECIAGVDDAVVVGVGAVIVCGILITMAITPPSVHQEIIRSLNYVTQVVVEAVKSFWGWFTRWITRIFTRTIAVEITQVIEIKTPTLELDKEKIETKELSKEDRLKLPKTAYYLAFADPSNNKYVSIKNIRSSQATAIMAYAMKVPCIANTNYDMLASVFTLYEINAQGIMKNVGYNPETPIDRPVLEKGTYHYHSNAQALVRSSKYPQGSYHNPHMFFELLY